MAEKLAVATGAKLICTNATCTRLGLFSVVAFQTEIIAASNLKKTSKTISVTTSVQKK